MPLRRCAVIVAFLLAFLAISGGVSGAEPQSSTVWRVAGGELVIELNQGVLSPLDIEVSSTRALGDSLPEHPLGYRRLRFEGLSIQQIGFSAPGGAVDEFFDGFLHYHGGLIIRIGNTALDLTDFRVAPHPQQGVFQLLDREGKAWATLDHGHYELVDENSALELRHANLSMTSDMAELIGRPTLSGQVIGVAHFRAPVVSAGSLAPVRGSQCSSPNWPTAPGFEANVALTAMDAGGGFNPVHFLRCQDCNGESGGPVVIAPNATLQNVGSADVPWWHQFTSPQPPYGNDQHPFLVWNLYRLDGDGRFEQIGVSGVKHAFFSVNSGCPCAGGNILWTDCKDTYSASNNDLGTYLAPRGEIVPADGLWGRCNSLFDSDCDGDQETVTTDPFDNRLRVMEQDLDPLAYPGARYFVEAWYVVRDDIDIFNTMGWREVTPTWNGATWEFPVAGDFNEGPALDAWVNPAALTPGQDSVVLETADGNVRVSVAVTDLQNGTWRYHYGVMNHDFMRAGTAGSEPNLELLTNVGFNAMEVPRATTASVTDIGFARADRTRGQDWATTVQPDAVRWENPGDTPLNWGTAFRFSMVVDRPPGLVTLRLFPDAAGAPLGVTVLGPEPQELIFGDGFEADP